MAILRTTLRFWVGSLLLLFAGHATAQKLQPFGPTGIDTDLQIFAPAELGSFGERPDPKEGYFFTYEKINWNIMGTNASTGIEAPIFTVFAASGDNFPVPTAATPAMNSISNDIPESNYGWGERYELGYMEGQSGWLAGVLSGPDRNDIAIYGSDTASTGPQQSVLVFFLDPNSILPIFSDLNNDGFDDDLDGDGIYGRDGTDTDGDFEPDAPAPIDTGDLADSPPSFQQLSVRSQTRVDGVELMKSHRFRPFHKGSLFEFYYGARYLRFDDRFDVSGTGGSLADSFWDTRSTCNLVGPQVAGRFIDTRGRWTFGIEGRFLASVNVQNTNLLGRLADTIDSSASPSSPFLNPYSFRRERRDVDFSPVAELRVETSYQLTKSFAFTLGYTALYAGNMTRAANQFNYNLGDLNLRSGGDQELFTNGVNFGVEFNR